MEECLSSLRTRKARIFLVAFIGISLLDPLYGKSLYRSASYLGRGDTGVAAAQEQEAIFYNPAGLAGASGLYVKSILLSPQIGVSTQVNSIYQDLVVNEKDQIEVLKAQVGKPYHLDFSTVSAVILRRVALAAFVSSQADFRVYRSREQRGMETLQGSFEVNQGLSFTVAESLFSDHLSFGLTARYLNRSEAKIEEGLIDAAEIKDIDAEELVKQGQGQGFDFGAQWKSDKGVRGNHFQLGLFVSDVGGTSLGEASDAPKPIIQNVNVGAAYILSTPYAAIRFLADFKDLLGEENLSTFKRIHLGADVHFFNVLGVSAGLNQGYFTGGIFANIRLLRIDASFYTEEAGQFVGQAPDRRVVVRVQAAI